MRLDHLLSKEFLPEPFAAITAVEVTRELPVDHSLFGTSSSSPGRRIRPPRCRPRCVGPSVPFSGSIAPVCARPDATLLLSLAAQRFASPFENSIASTSIFVLQAIKSQRWMPWHLEPKKDVAICDKPRGVDKRTLIRGCPNGETPSGVLVRPDDSRLNI